MEEHPLKSFSKDIIIDNKVIARVSGLLIEEGIICLDSLCILSPEIEYIRILNEVGAEVYASRCEPGSVVVLSNKFPPCAQDPVCGQMFKIEIMMSDNRFLKICKCIVDSSSVNKK